VATTRTPPSSVPPDRPGRSSVPTRRRAPDLDFGPGEAPRRPLAAGYVIVVVVICFLVGGLLNAAGIRKTALGQDVGAKRDISKLFADPLYDVSHFLRVDQLRQSLKNALGRGSDDDVDLSLPSPTTTTAPEPANNGGVTGSTPTSTTQPVKKRAFSPAQPMSLWVGGDSLSITPGESVINIAPSTGVINITGNTVDGHVATGLARPEVFNWPAHMAQVAAADNPAVYVLTIGSNDDQTLTGDGGGEQFGTQAWQDEYRRRVGGMMDQMTGDGKHVLFWIGIPITRNVARSQDHYLLMNDIYRTEAEKRPGKVVYIDIYDMFKAPDGGYADYLGIGGVQVRTPDGLHFTRAGGDMIADKLVKAMQDTFDLTSWQKAQAATTTTTTTTTATAPQSGPTTTAKPKSSKKKS
jgi:uncharacterized protein